MKRLGNRKTVTENRPVVYICSPYAGEVQRNTERAREYCRTAYDEGYLPVAPHLYFPQFLRDELEEEREFGLAVCERLIPLCSALWVCGGRISAGMTREIACAERCGIPVLYLPENRRAFVS